MTISIDTRAIAESLYYMAEDMDAGDYAENKEQDIDAIENAIFHIKTIAENEDNLNYWRTFLELLTRFENWRA